MKFSFFKPKAFNPDFPIIPLLSSEEEALRLLSQHGPVRQCDPGSDHTICQKSWTSETEETRISVGIWNGRVRFTNYLTKLFNQTEKQRAQKLSWFVDQYGGGEEFEEPRNTGHMLLLRNPKRKIMIIFGLHLGPVRIIDQDSLHWEEHPESGKDPG